MNGIGQIIEALAGEFLDERFEVSASLLNLFVLVGNIRLGFGLINGVFGLVSVLLDEIDDGGDGAAVFGVLLSLRNSLDVININISRSRNSNIPFATC